MSRSRSTPALFAALVHHLEGLKLFVTPRFMALVNSIVISAVTPPVSTDSSTYVTGLWLPQCSTRGLCTSSTEERHELRMVLSELLVETIKCGCWCRVLEGTTWYDSWNCCVTSSSGAKRSFPEGAVCSHIGTTCGPRGFHFVVY